MFKRLTHRTCIPGLGYKVRHRCFVRFIIGSTPAFIPKRSMYVFIVLLRGDRYGLQTDGQSNKQTREQKIPYYGSMQSHVALWQERLFVPNISIYNYDMQDLETQTRCNNAIFIFCYQVVSCNKWLIFALDINFLDIFDFFYWQHLTIRLGFDICFVNSVMILWFYNSFQLCLCYRPRGCIRKCNIECKK